MFEINPSPTPAFIDSIATFSSMSTTLTIRNLNEEVKQKLRLRAAPHPNFNGSRSPGNLDASDQCP